jgi:hypothetical protein
MINWKANASMNTDFGINCCALSLNVFYIDELQEWLDKNFSKTPNGNAIPYMLIRGEGSLDAACTPLALREAIWKKYGEDHVVSKILKDVPYHNHMETVDYLDRLDPTRKQNWRHTFKEIVQYFKP